MKKILWIITCVLFVATILCACSSDEFPTGTYTFGSHLIEFKEDGTFTYMIGNDLVTEASYSIQGDELIWLSDDGSCEDIGANPATYRWEHEDGKLNFVLVGEDQCTTRYERLSLSWIGPE